MRGYFCVVLVAIFAAREVFNTQNRYYFTHEFADISDLNESYLKLLKNTRFFKWNRTTAAANVTIRTFTEWNDKLELKIEGFMFLSNEYRRGPIDFGIKLCDILRGKKFFDINEILAQNSNLTKCPIKPGVYNVFNVVPDAREYPPFIPAGKWLLKIHFILDGRHFGTILWRTMVKYYN